MTRQYLRNFVFYPFSVLALIIIIIWVAAPFVVKYYLTSYIEEQDQTLSIDSLAIDFFPPKVDLKKLTITNLESDTLTVNRATFEVKIWPLLTQTLNISEANIDGLNITVVQHEKDWIVAGINIAQYREENTRQENLSSKHSNEKDSTLTTVPWTIKLPIFSVTNSHVTLSRQPALTAPAELDSFTLTKFIANNVYGQGLQWEGEIDFSALMNQATVSAKTKFNYSPERANADIQITNTHIPIESLQHFIPAPYNEGKGELSIDSHFQLQQTQSKHDPLFEVKNLTFNANIEALDLNLNATDRITTQSTILDIAQSSIQFVSVDQLIIKANVNLESEESSFTQTNITANYDSFTLSSLFSLVKSDDSISAKSHQLDINIQDLKAILNKESKLLLETATLKAQQLTADIENQQAPNLTGTSLQFTSNNLDSFLTNNKRITSWKRAGFDDLTFTQQDNTFSALLAQLTIADLTFSENLTNTNKTKKLPSLLHLDSMNIKDITANQDGTKIDTITTESMKLNVILDAEKNLANFIGAQKAQSKAAPQSFQKNSDTLKTSDEKQTINNTPNTTPTSKSPYYFVLNTYDSLGDTSLSVQDKSITPSLQRTINIDELSLRNLNTQDKKQAAVISLKARNGKYSTINSEITIWPIADKLTTQSKLVIKEAELPPYSSYIANVLGYQIDSGHLDLELTLNADNGVLDGNSHVLLRQFNLGGRQESSSVISAGAIPLNIAVGLLKNNDDNIDLDIPLSGDINNPEFGWTNFLVLPIRKALYKISSNYLIQTFVPYANVITIAQYAGEQLLKIRVEPLIFEIKDSQLNTSQNIFLQQLTTLMKDKESSQLKACGITSHVDLDFEKPPSTLDLLTKEKALTLAQERADSLKTYLVAQGIPSSRILLCSPAIDLSNNSQPRVELNF